MLGDVSGGSGNCLHDDITSKYHRRYQNFQFTTTISRQLSFGLSEMVNGNPQTIF